MKPSIAQRRLLAWLLYCSVLFSAFACSIGHGQLAGLQLSGLDGPFCSFSGKPGSGVDLGSDVMGVANPSGGAGCALSSAFGALILAAFFGLLGLLAAGRAPRLAVGVTRRPVRYLWPSANPRASPVLG